MKKFRINVNGKSYEVEVEELGGVASPAPVAAPAPTAAPVATPAAAPAPAPAAPAASGSAGGVTVAAPMPGNIIKVNVNVGDKVTSGQAVVILEAMKMENEIAAPQDGVVASINVTQGATVNTGDVLITLN
ncbi:MAG: biotin/lipoyl-binding protein [Clostridia bacterium]|nr:biotin/lipoyl-binding protein [Clostridia bacterium]MBQ9997679.1 biotin/lipoyl-binding protein [Clostridia bacterium]